MTFVWRTEIAQARGQCRNFAILWCRRLACRIGDATPSRRNSPTTLECIDPGFACLAVKREGEIPQAQKSGLRYTCFCLRIYECAGQRPASQLCDFVVQASRLQHWRRRALAAQLPNGTGVS